MKLVKIYPEFPKFRFICSGCGKRVDDPAKGYADLDGPAFQSYYCEECAKKEKEE